MAPKPSSIQRRPAGTENDVEIGPNVDTTCFSIYGYDGMGNQTDCIHICDWPSFRASVEQLLADREAE